MTQNTNSICKKYWKRFLDDCFVPWTKSEDELRTFHSILNNLHNDINTLKYDFEESPRTSSIVQIIFSFWSFKISEGMLRNQNIIIGLHSCSNQRLIYLVPFLTIIVFVSTILLNVAKLQ